jgi:hypothetical protein
LITNWLGAAFTIRRVRARKLERQSRRIELCALPVAQESETKPLAPRTNT